MTDVDLRTEASVIALRRPDAISPITLAELALRKDFPEAAIPSCVAILASPAVTDPVARFEQLMDAIRDRAHFVSDPQGYAMDRDWPTRPTALDALDEKLQTEVDAAIWSLLHPSPACVRCQRYKPSNRWNAADWPRSSYCEHHQDAS